MVGGRVLGVDERGEALEHRVAALDRARAGADDLDEQGLGALRVLGQRLQERAPAGADLRLGVLGDLARGLRHPLHELLGGRRRTARGSRPPCS